MHDPTEYFMAKYIYIYFNVSMHNIMSMQISYGRESLTKIFERLWLADFLVFVLIGKKSSILGQFHYHVNYIAFDEGVP